MKKLIPLSSRNSRKLSATRLVVILMFAAAILSIVGSPKIIHSAGSEKSESSAVTPFVGPLTLTVNTLGDAVDTNVGDGLCDTDSGTAGDQCTFRAAIQETNFVSSNDTINFSLPPNSTIILNTALSFSGNITIVGPGANLLTIQRSTAAGTPNFSIFTFIPINGNFNDSISGLTIANGINTAPISGGGTSGLGGCVVNLSPDILTLTDTVFSGCNAQNGGAIYNSGTATLTNSTVNNNVAVNGGGIYSSGTLTLTNSAVNGNHANNGAGGGIFNNGGTLSLLRSTVSSNACDAQAGGIFNGGGVTGPVGTATLTNSTVSGNNATGILTSGIGGIFNANGGNTLSLTSTTVTANTATGSGSGVAGIFNASGSTANLGNSIVAKNTSAFMFQDLNGTFTSQGYNLIGQSTGNGLTNGSNGDQVGTSGSPIDPLLGPLSDNGGPTKTHALLVGSLAIDAGNSSQTIDQRGQPRPIDDPNVTNAAGGNGSDIGAYEANIFQVNTTVDDDDGACTALGTGNGCTLREAINAANANFGEVAFAPALTSGGPATITLSTALPDITASIIIQGPGANLLTVKRSTVGGTPDFRIFTIVAGTSVNISGMTIANGKLTAPLINGGGVLNSGTLTLTDCKLYGNSTANLGGGVFNNGPSLTIINCNVGGTSAGQANSATPGGSGIFSSAGTLLMTGGSIAGNSRNGITIIGGTATLNGVAITNNAQTNGAGGGIAVNPGTMNIINCLIAGNTATAFGGGIWNGGGTVKVINTTISANFAAESGGGVINQVGSMTLTNVTITNNRSDSDNSGGERGGGIARNGSSIVLKNTIVAGNFRGASPSTTADDDFNVFSTVDSSSSFNLIGTCSSCGLTNGTNNNQVGVVNPGLGPLLSNGGPTQTHALLPSSPAIDAGDNCVLDNSCSPVLASAITSDQRGAGFNRSADGSGHNPARVDIGAYEVQSILVTNTADSGVGSLRQAIIDANASPDTNAINFQAGLTGTITLLSALPDVLSSFSINGPGATLLTVARSSAGGTASFRIFNISSATVKLSGLTLSGGTPGGGVPFPSGGISSDNATLTLTNITVTGGANGAALANSAGTLNVLNSTVSGNVANGSFGAGIYNYSGTINVVNSTISGNTNSPGAGGGIFVGSGEVTLTNSTVSGNTAGAGGGIYNNGTVTLTNCTVSGNNAIAARPDSGGGINNSGLLNINNSTVSGNTGSGFGGGGIFSGNAIDTAFLRNTIVANNTINGTGPDLKGTFNSQDYNLIENTSGATFTGTTTHNITNSSPVLGPLASNGGPTQTQALLPGSPAINAGSNANLPADNFDLDGDGNTAEPIPFDQRGLTRITNTTVDIGAFESRGFTIAATSGSGQTTAILTAFALPLKATVSSAFGEPVAGGVVTFVAPPNASGPSASFPGSAETVSATIDNSGVATSPTLTANTSAGGYNVIAGLGAGSPTAVFALSNKASTFTQLSSSVNPSNVGQSVTYTATVSTAGGTPTGTVQFKDGGTQLGAPQALDISFPPKATLSTIPLTAGTHTITAEYSGDAKFFSSSSLSIDQVVNLWPTSTGVTSSVNPSDFGQSVTFTASVTSSSGTPTGTVQFKDGGSNLGAPQTLNVSGVTTFSTSALTVGPHTITADYSGDNTFAASTGTLSGGQVVKALPSLSINDVSITEGDSGTKSLNFTVTLSAASSQTVTVNYLTVNNSAASPSDYTAIPTTTLTFNPGDATKTIPVTVNGDQSFEPNETFLVILSNSTNATISKSSGVGTILDDDAQGGNISFAQANYSVGESAGLVTVTVKRTGNTSGAATVSYATDDGVQPGLPCSSTSGMASSRCDYTTAMGRLNFAAGETQKTLNVLVNRDSYTEGPESFIVFLLDTTGGAVLTAPSGTIVTIVDDSSGLPPNAIDDAQFFVLQHYHDFLNRQPDASGLNFWTNQITSCGSDQQCIELRRINVSAAFFLSIEFQETGYLVERLYKAAYGDADQTSTFGGNHQFKAPIIRVNEFLPDTQEIGLGVVVGQTGWEAVLENNKRAFTAEFVQRARFTSVFPPSMTPAQFVDTLNTNAGNPLAPTERNQLVADLTANTKTRAEVLRAVAEDPDLFAAESNRAFVLMQFFGYLRRNPNDAPDVNYTGYDFWLTKLNQFNGNFVNADMVQAFITSGEYRQRFGP